jgi:hypothetical protein
LIAIVFKDFLPIAFSSYPFCGLDVATIMPEDIRLDLGLQGLLKQAS